MISCLWDIPFNTKPTGGMSMNVAVKEYDAKIDSKKRVTLRNTQFEYYHVQEMANGVIILEPRELTVPFQVSAKTLSMMDASMKNLKQGKASAPVDLFTGRMSEADGQAAEEIGLYLHAGTDGAAGRDD